MESAFVSARCNHRVLVTLPTCFGRTECVEFIDSSSIRGINTYNKHARQWPEKDSLFFKIQGPTPVMLEESARIVKLVAEKNGGTSFEFAATEAEGEKLWEARKNAMLAGFAMFPGAKAIATDVWCGCSVVCSLVVVGPNVAMLLCLACLSLVCPTWCVTRRRTSKRQA